MAISEPQTTSSTIHDHKYTFVWHTLPDERSCEVCRALDGKTWTDQNLFANVLYDSIWGNVWDLENDMPLTHGGEGTNCRCNLEVQYNSSLEELLGLEKDTQLWGEFRVLTSNVKEMREDIRQFEVDLKRAENRIDSTRAQLITYMLLLRKMHLPPEVEKAINIMVRARMVSEQASRAMNLLMAATLAGGPVAWAFALASMGIAVIGSADIAMDLGSQ